MVGAGNTPLSFMGLAVHRLASSGDDKDSDDGSGAMTAVGQDKKPAYLSTIDGLPVRVENARAKCSEYG